MLKSKAKWIFNHSMKDENQSIIDTLLEERGIKTSMEKQQFLHPKLDDLASPELFSQIDIAMDRIYTAIEKEEKIIVYGDYDADGVTSTALLTKVLTKLGADVQYYIPNRFREGYGLHPDPIKQFHEEGITLIITVDNGIANIAEADLAKQLGIDLIITDHHEIQDQIPDAYAIIHPKLSPSYAFKELAGVGIAFQFASHLLKAIPNNLLDLAAIGTIADLVPLVKENRILAFHGLQQLANTEHIGLKVLLEKCKLEETISERDVSFIIAPRLNAVGRLGDADLAVQLLITENLQEAERIVEQIEELNRERQKIVEKIVTEAEKQIQEEHNIIILYDENWHEGVLGIAASRLVQNYHKPVILLKLNTESNELKGSARSIPAFNLFENCMKIRHLFLQFGGHAQAAGMTLALENISEIRLQLNKMMAEQLTMEDYRPQINISKTLTLDEISEELIQEINLLAPFGVDNEEPVFHLHDTPTNIRQIGQDNNHLKLQFRKDSHAIEAVGFNYGHVYYLLSEQVPVSIVGKLQINEWNGNRTVQIMMEDMAIEDWLLLDYRGKQDITSIQSMKQFFKHHTIVTNDINSLNKYINVDEYQMITYQSEIASIHETDVLYVYDLPDTFHSLENIIKKTQPKCIHVSYHITENAYLHNLPSREEFKWLYGFIVKHSPLQLKVDLPKIMTLQRWSKDKVVFMLKVFLDLQFITVENNVITVVPSAKKQALQNSKTYQQRMEQSDIEKTLYYSTYTELKNWFKQYLTIDQERKEVLN